MKADEFVDLTLMALFIIIAVNYIYHLISKKTKQISTIPGLQKSDSKFGNLLEIKNSGSLHQFLTDLHEKFGEIAMFYWNDQIVISVCGNELFKSVQNLFDRPALIFGNFQEFIGENCLQYSNGDEGQNRRKQYDKAFEHGMIIRYISKMESVGESNLKDWHSSKVTVNSIEHWCYTMAVKSFLKACIIPEEQDSEYCDVIIALYKRVWRGLEKRFVEGKSLSDDEEIQFQKDKTHFYSIIGDIVDKRLEFLENADLEDEQLLLIDYIILYHREMNRHLIENEVMIYIIGGFHTTGNALSWCIYYLAKHPECQETLFMELSKRQIQFRNTSECYKSILDLKFLRACIDETLRLSQLAPYAARVADEDRYLLNYKIPANTPIILALGVSLKDEKIFINSDRFDPKRFVNSTFPSFAFVPFGFAGKRKCPGERFSYLELSIWLIQLVRKYRFTLTNPQQTVNKVFGLVTCMSEDVSVEFTERTTTL